MTEVVADDRLPICPQCGWIDIHGVEIQGVYDGVLFWHCPNCSLRWPRFTPPGRLYNRAIEIIANWAAAEEAQP